MERTIFAADPAVVAELVKQREDLVVVDLAAIRFVASRHSGDLHVSDVLQPSAELDREIALDDLGVIKIHLHLEVRHADFLAYRMRVGLGG